MIRIYVISVESSPCRESLDYTQYFGIDTVFYYEFMEEKSKKYKRALANLDLNIYANFFDIHPSSVASVCTLIDELSEGQPCREIWFKIQEEMDIIKQTKPIFE